MAYFSVIENVGAYRATNHEFKLLFQPRTRVIPTESEIISRFGLDVKSSEQIRETNGQSDYLFDFIVVLTAVSEEKQFKKFQRTIRVLELELTDDKGVMRCSLFGHFIDAMKVGFFICLANVDGIVKNDPWWYHSCKCHKAVKYDEDTDSYYCADCETYVSDVTPRFRLRLVVTDITEKAEFVVFDYDCASLLSKTCASMIREAKVPSLEYPDELNVKRICFDENIMNEFKEEGSIKTPEMSKFKAPMSELIDDGLADGGSADDTDDIPLIDLYNDGQITPKSVGDCSNAAACLAPQKRKNASRIEHAATSKKRGQGKPIKIEKD
ncbi:hypothetical protein SESBI_44939 [Sesbania bispinosa]|nr:hypothetical protein SESBI_44939 [Sesbania bispinosa]